MTSMMNRMSIDAKYVTRLSGALIWDLSRNVHFSMYFDKKNFILNGQRLH